MMRAVGEGPESAVKTAPSTGKVSATVGFVKSLWTNPFRWQVVKSMGMFGVAVFIMREMGSADEAAQQKEVIKDHNLIEKRIRNKHELYKLVVSSLS